MTRAALIGRERPKTAQKRKQISRKLSDHAVANTWWSPSSLPAVSDRVTSYPPSLLAGYMEEPGKIGPPH